MHCSSQMPEALIWKHCMSASDILFQYLPSLMYSSIYPSNSIFSSHHILCNFLACGRDAEVRNVQLLWVRDSLISTVHTVCSELQLVGREGH